MVKKAVTASVAWVKAHKGEVVHDAALFVASTGIADAVMAGKPVTRDLIVGGIVTAGRRLVVLFAGKLAAAKA